MNALLKNLQRVANDWRGPHHPRVLSVVTVRERRPLAALAIAALTASLLVAAAGTAWFAHELNGTGPALLAPAQTAATQVAPKSDSSLPKGKKAQATDALADIVLPASQLDRAAAPSDPDITIVATKLGDLPVLRDSAAHGAVTMSQGDESSGDDLLEQANTAMQGGDSDEAYALYEEVLTGDPGNHTALAAEAFLLARSGDYDGAAKADRRLLKLYPRDAAARRNLVTALGQSSSPDAEDELATLVAASPGDAAAQAALARKMIAEGEADEALPHLDRAVRAAPAELSYRLELASLYDKLDLPAQAASLYRDILRASADPDASEKLPVSLSAIQRRATYLEGKIAAGGGANAADK